MKIPRNQIARVVEACMMGFRKAYVVLAPDVVVTAARHDRPDGRSRSTTIVLTIGKPNFKVREFVKRCKAAGQRFPVRKIQLEAYKVGK
jgi:hypothetical protein